MTSQKSQATKLAVMSNNIEYIKGDVTELKQFLNQLNTKIEKLDNVFVTRVEFEPIQKVVYGLVAVTGIAVLGALISLVVIG